MQRRGARQTCPDAGLLADCHRRFVPLKQVFPQYSYRYTGNRGIGHAISVRLAQSGADVAIIYRSSKDATQVAEDIAKKYNVKCQAYQCDVRLSMHALVNADVASQVGDQGVFDG